MENYTLYIYTLYLELPLSHGIFLWKSDKTKNALNFKKDSSAFLLMQSTYTPVQNIIKIC